MIGAPQKKLICGSPFSITVISGWRQVDNYVLYRHSRWFGYFLEDIHWLVFLVSLQQLVEENRCPRKKVFARGS